MKLSKKYSLSNISKFIKDPSLRVDFKIISDQVTNKTICVNLYRQNIYKWSQPQVKVNNIGLGLVVVSLAFLKYIGYCFSIFSQTLRPSK